MGTDRRPRVQQVDEDAGVTALELFFDLVFVFALTQVTLYMSNNPTAGGVLRGMVVLALFWWCWVGFSWIGNNVRADEGLTRAIFFLVMATMFVAALAVPRAFGGDPAGLHGPLVLAICYGLVRMLHILLFAEAARSGGDAGLMKQLARFSVVTAISVTLVVTGALLDSSWQLAFWLGALAMDYVGTGVIGSSGWRLRSVAHFTERHGLIIIVALGESIVSIGAGVRTEGGVTWAIILAAVLGIALTGAMWWIYFDVTAIAVKRRLAGLVGPAQTAMARDLFSYIHLVLVAGIVLAALGVKKVLGYVSGEQGHRLGDSLSGVAPYALHIGTAVMVAGLVGLRYRSLRTVGRPRSLATLALVATLPAATLVPALADLGMVAGIMLVLVVWEATRYSEARHGIRHLGQGPAGRMPRPEPQ